MSAAIEQPTVAATPADLVRELRFAADAWTREAVDFRNSTSSTPGDECAYLAGLLSRAAHELANLRTEAARLVQALDGWQATHRPAPSHLTPIQGA